MCYDDFYEPHCIEKDMLYEVTDVAKDIIRQLYSTDTLDLQELEANIHELCHVLMIKPNPGQLTIERKSKTPAPIVDWLQFNQNYLKSLTA